MKYIGLFDEKEDIVTKEKLDAKQDKITVKGIVRGDGSGNLSAAQTVNGETIELNAASVGLGNVDNTSDANKPISTATQDALNGKQDKITASGILKGNGAGGISKAVANRDYATCTNLRNGSADESLQTLSSQSEGWSAMAEGISTTASGIASHAEGSGTIASGNVSHTEGDSTEATGESSHAEGFYVIANHRSQHAQGEYNIVDDSTADETERGKYAHIVGNGTDSARSNAHTLDWSGNAWFAGDVYVGSTSGTNKDEGSKKLIKEGDAGLLPTVTTADNGKFLRVVSGAWAAATVDNANGVSF